MQTEEHVRENRIIENLLKVLDLSDVCGACVAAHGQTLAGMDPHAADNPPCRSLARRPCAVRRAGDRPVRNSMRDMGTGLSMSGRRTPLLVSRHGVGRHCRMP